MMTMASAPSMNFCMSPSPPPIPMGIYGMAPPPPPMGISQDIFDIIPEQMSMPMMSPYQPPRGIP